MLSPESKKRYEAFWHASAHERCCLFLTSPSGAPEPGRRSDDLRAFWEDIEKRCEYDEACLRAKNFHADAFKHVFVNFGPGSLSACLRGGSYRWAWDTVWFENEPVISDWDSVKPPVLDAQSHMYGLVEEFTQALLKRGKNEYCVSISDIGGLFDIIAALRGTQDLLADLIDCPEEVKAYAQALSRVWCDYYQAQSARLLSAQGCMCSWMSIYSEKSYYPLQCDFSAMVSPDMFGEFILPGLKYQSEHMERSIYHLDGPGEIPHLKQLLSLERLNAVQWVSGSGAPPITDPCWFDMYDEIQRAGKGLALIGAPAEGVEALINRVSTRGLFLSVRAQDDNQAREIERIVNLAGVR